MRLKLYEDNQVVCDVLAIEAQTCVCDLIVICGTLLTDKSLKKNVVVVGRLDIQLEKELILNTLIELLNAMSSFFI